MPTSLGESIDFRPGQTYDGDAEPADRAEARQDAVEKFRKTAILQTRGQIKQMAEAVLGLCMQLRVIGGSFKDTDIL